LAGGKEFVVGDADAQLAGTWVLSDRVLPGGDTIAQRYAQRLDLSSVVSNVVVVASAIVAMLILSPTLTLLSVVIVPVFVLLSNRVGRTRREARRKTQVSLAEMSAITQESLSVSGVLLSKVFGRQDREIDRYGAENARQADLQVRQAMTGRGFFAVMQAFFGIAPALLYSPRSEPPR
jgi:ATP-binding cassette subfamily B protein